MKAIQLISAIREEIRNARSKGKTVALVPTMGYLHEGHLSLVRLAAERAERVIVSIFVNPSQFNDPRDLEKYPRDLARDMELLSTVRCDLVFAPEAADIYSSDFQTWIVPGALAEKLEGLHRPGHFRGVTTIVGKLFNIVQPDLAVFGEKDFQQLRIIEQMTADLGIPVEILRAPLIREPDGLAMSSRNTRLSPEERAKALALSKGLFAARDLFRSGERRSSELVAAARAALSDSGLRVDYVSLVDEQSLDEIGRVVGAARLLVAAYAGEVRLIDNIELGENGKK